MATVGAYGLGFKKDADTLTAKLVPGESKFETTVLTIGGGDWGNWVSVSVAILHVMTWVAALLVTLLGTYAELDELSKPPKVLTNATTNDTAALTPDVIAKPPEAIKELTLAYGLAILAVVVLVLVHTSCVKKEDAVAGPLISMLLLFVVIFENILGCTVLTYTVASGLGDKLISLAIASSGLVALGSAMIIAFYVNWSHHGDLEDRLSVPMGKMMR